MVVRKSKFLSQHQLYSSFSHFLNDEMMYDITWCGKMSQHHVYILFMQYLERWGAGVETQKNVRGEIGGWGRIPFNETYAPSLSTIYDGA